MQSRDEATGLKSQTQLTSIIEALVSSVGETEAKPVSSESISAFTEQSNRN